MGEDRVKQLLQQGVTAAKAGQKQQAFDILQRVVKIEPNNETAWLWLSSVARNDQERIFCLKQLYSINPKNELAIKGLKAFGMDPTDQPKVAAPIPVPDVPAVTPDRLREVQPVVEEFLATYRTMQYSPLEIEWTKKEKQRYGEATARRIQRTAYATGAIVVIAVFGLVGFLLYGLLSSGGDTDTVAGNTSRLVTAGPSVIPSITPTATLNPNTPIPANLFDPPPPIVAVSGISRGSEEVVPAPTNVYPPVQLDVQRALPAFNLGDYTAIRDVSVRSQGSTTCSPEYFYYDALSYAREGGSANLAEAEDLLESGLASEATVDNNCTDSVLLKAGLCYVNYLQALASRTNTDGLLAQALPICQEAHNGDERFVDAAIYLADVYLAQGNPSAAAQVLEETYNFTLSQSGVQPNISNEVLLYKLADVEVARGNYEAAINYIGNALYINPISEPGLIKLVDTHLRWADNTASPQQRQIRYGYAAVLAEEQYLSRYPGAAMGYVFVAEGRIREGNPEKALDYLGPVLQAGSQPNSGIDLVALERAQALRVEIAVAEGDWPTALTYLNPLLENSPDNVQWREWRKDAALATEDYETALDDINFLIGQNPDNASLILQQAQLLSQTCQYISAIPCEPTRVQAALSESFIAGLSGVNASQARLYLAEVTFAELPDDATSAALQALADTVVGVLAVEETPEAYVLLGRIYSRLGEYDRAIATYQWVSYWATLYDYPFADDVQDELAAAQSAQQSAS